ncbi:MAG TPA: HPP family protein [Chthonomonadales bacterium]|nr:HPP family protein [Chthonomonadales bacterium]
MRITGAENRAREGRDSIHTLLHRLRLDWLLRHFPPRLVRAVYVFVNSFLTVGLLAVLAFVSRSPIVFPSLGPTAYLLFFTPLARAASPRNTIVGHAIGILCGYGAYVVTGAGAVPFGAHSGIFWPRILAAAFSLSATGALMVLLEVSHPPAGATTLIISLGIIARPHQLLVIETAVFLLVAQALAINRAAGIPYPLWASSEPYIPGSERAP